MSVEVTRVDPKTGNAISKRTDELTLSPHADIFLGQARQQGIEVRYQVVNVRVAAGETGTGASRDTSLPAPFPIMFGK